MSIKSFVLWVAIVAMALIASGPVTAFARSHGFPIND